MLIKELRLTEAIFGLILRRWNGWAFGPLSLSYRYRNSFYIFDREPYFVVNMYDISLKVRRRVIYLVLILCFRIITVTKIVYLTFLGVLNNL